MVYDKGITVEVLITSKNQTKRWIRWLFLLGFSSFLKRAVMKSHLSHLLTIPTPS